MVAGIPAVLMFLPPLPAHNHHIFYIARNPVENEKSVAGQAGFR
jgi:hypothetical protein